MSEIAFSRSGDGEPLLLIHAAGMTRRAWEPLLPMLERERDVIAIDLPGHGASPPVPPHLAMAPPAFARLLADLLDELEIERAHVAGNSLGGWTALELARMGRAQSIVALGPAGLWRRGPFAPMLRLIAMHLAARAGRRAGTAIARSERGRRLFALGVGEPAHMPPEVAARLVVDLASATSFIGTVIDTHLRRFAGGDQIRVPVTVVYGQRDRIVPRAARRREELPPHTRWLEVPHLGHIPMWDDPQLVARLLLGKPFDECQEPGCA